MRILQVHKYFWHRDGGSNYAWDLSASLTKAGHTVIPFSMQHPQAMPSPYTPFFVSQMDLNDPSKVSFGNKIKYASRFIYSHEAREKMIKLLDQEPVDIVHLHNIYHHITPSILPVFKARNIPVVMTLHDYKLVCPNYPMFHHGAVHEEDARGWYLTCVKNKCFKDSRAQSLLVTAEMIWHHKFKKYYERGVDKFIAPSQFMLDTCVRLGQPREKFVHIPNPIDARTWNLAPDDAGYVAYIGRLSEEKGLKVLVAAARLTPTIRYKLIGTGEQEAELKALASDLPNVEFCGFKTGAELRQLVAQARLLVLPAVWYENYPISVLEAKAMGKIMIASRIGGLPELLPNDLLFKPGEAGQLAELVKHWYNAPLAARREVGLGLRHQVEHVNDPHKHVAAIVGLYESLV